MFSVSVEQGNLFVSNAVHYKNKQSKLCSKRRFITFLLVIYLTACRALGLYYWMPDKLLERHLRGGPLVCFIVLFWLVLKDLITRLALFNECASDYLVSWNSSLVPYDFVLNEMCFPQLFTAGVLKTFHCLYQLLSLAIGQIVFYLYRFNRTFMYFFRNNNCWDVQRPIIFR